MEDLKFLTVVFMMFLFPFLTSCQRKEIETVEMPVNFAKADTGSGEEVIGVKTDSKENIGESIKCRKEEFPITYTEYFPSDCNPEDIPEIMDIVYYNSALNCDLVTEGRLIEKGIDETNTWCEWAECEIIFEADSENNGIWSFGNKEYATIDMKSERPVWDGYEAAVLKITGFEGQGYKVVDASWKGEPDYCDGYYERKALYTLKRQNKGYFGVYEGTACDVICEESELMTKIKEDTELLTEYRELNEDVYGIIRIPGTNLNHPVMKCVEDEDFYLWHDLEKKYNTHGIPFIGKESDYEKKRGNTVIYGHRSADRDVFGELDKYEDIDYYKDHPVIETVSENGTSRWLITAYYLSCNSDEDAFDYSNENAFMSLDEFEKYMDNVQKRNFYKNDMTYGINDAYLTLSSCSKERTGEGNNRMAILAVRIPPDYDVSKFVEESERNPNPYYPEQLRKK